MTGADGQQSRGDPADPHPPAPEEAPLTVELLADLHAGVLEEQVAAQLRRRVEAEAQAGTVLAALDRTVADLGTLARQRATRMPEAVAHRIDAALAAETEARHPAPGREPGRATRRRRTRRVGMAALAAAAAVIGVVALSGVRPEVPGSPQAVDALGGAPGIQPGEPLALTRGDLGGTLDQVLQARDYGPLTPPQMLRSCLSAHDVPPGREPLGALEVTLDGRRGVLLALPTGRTGRIRLLVVGPNCGPGNPAHLAEYVAGR